MPVVTIDSVTPSKLNCTSTVTENRNSIPTKAFYSYQQAIKSNGFFAGRSQADVLCFTCKGGENTLFMGKQLIALKTIMNTCPMVDFLTSVSQAQSKSINSFI